MTWKDGKWIEPERRNEYPLPRIFWADLRDLPRIFRNLWARIRSRFNW